MIPERKFGYNKKGSKVKLVCSVCLEEKSKTEISIENRRYICTECLEGGKK